MAQDPASPASNPVAADLLAEYRALDELCRGLTPDDWQRRSAFHGWTPWDEVAHLLFFDETGLQSVREPEQFAADAQALHARTAQGEEISAIARERFGHLTGAELLARWRPHYEQLAEALAQMDPRHRLGWYGPPMSARSFATARLMETWAHGQDIWDVMQRRRPFSPRLRHIAHLGVSTFGWTFVNRGLPVPDVQPGVALQTPDGDTWTWGTPDSPDRVTGPAEDFCLLVTQRRHLADTRLQPSPGAVSQWLAMAQCFAGAPAEGPAPGVRKLEF